MDAIVATNLTVYKAHKEVLRQINVRVKTGSVTGLIGPSGSGKTTLMRAIVGVQRYNGELTVLSQEAASASLRTKIGYVTQSPAVYTDISVEENLRYFASIAGVSAEKVADVIAMVDLKPQAKQVIGDLSGGQRARVSLAVALLGDPELLIMDEPTVGLDPVLRNQIWSIFRRLATEGTTVLVSSHVMDEADRCDELILLRDGSVLWNESRQGLLNHVDAETVGEAFLSVIEEQEKAT